MYCIYTFVSSYFNIKSQLNLVLINDSVLNINDLTKTSQAELWRVSIYLDLLVLELNNCNWTSELGCDLIHDKHIFT